MLSHLSAPVRGLQISTSDKREHLSATGEENKPGVAGVNNALDWSDRRFNRRWAGDVRHMVPGPISERLKYSAKTAADFAMPMKYNPFAGLTPRRRQPCPCLVSGEERYFRNGIFAGPSAMTPERCVNR